MTTSLLLIKPCTYIVCVVDHIKLRGLNRAHHANVAPDLSWVPVLGRMKGVEVFGVCPQLLNSTSMECVTASDQHSQSILHQPETHLVETVQYTHYIR